jgi:hypothetical protein
MTVEEIIALAIAADIERGFPARVAQEFNALSPMARAAMHSRAKTVIAALDAAGYVVVPKEPTEEMRTSGIQAYDENGPSAAAIWRAMIEALPK